MRNANWTRILTVLLALLAFYALLAVLAGIIQRFIVPLLLVILAAILAFILTPVVDFIQHRAHLYRWISILLTYLWAAAVLAALGFFLTEPLLNQTKSLADAVRNPTHIQNLTLVRDTTVRIGASAGAMSTAIRNVDTCSAAAYVGASQYLAASCPSSTVPGSQTLPHLIATLDGLLPDLGKTSIRPSGASLHSTRHHAPLAPIATTEVPPSYLKPLDRALSKLKAKTAKARATLNATVGGGSSGSIPAAGSAVLKAAHGLQRQSRLLTSKVKHTPIIILAIQRGMDSRHVPIDIRSLFGKAVDKFSSQGGTVLNNAVTILTSTITVIFDLFIVVIMSFYLLADGGRFIGWCLGLVPERHREQAAFFVRSLDTVLGGYIRGQVIVAITIGVLAGAGCYVLGVPYALLIGIFAFLAESIPVIGPVLASIPACLISVFSQPLPKPLFVIGWFILVQQIEQNVVGPRITGHAVGIHPVLAMVAIIIGLEVGGFWGAFLAVPVTGILQIVIREAYRYLILQQPLPTAAVPDGVEVPDEDQLVKPPI